MVRVAQVLYFLWSFRDVIRICNKEAEAVKQLSFCTERENVCSFLTVRKCYCCMHFSQVQIVIDYYSFVRNSSCT